MNSWEQVLFAVYVLSLTIWLIFIPALVYALYSYFNLVFCRHTMILLSQPALDNGIPKEIPVCVFSH